MSDTMSDDGVAVGRIVCTCLELTTADFVNVMTENPELDFERLLAKSGAGSKCTACRLDLETIYVDRFDTLVRSGVAAKSGDGTGAGRTSKRLDLSLRAFLRSGLRMLDRIAPMHPVMLRDFSPVVAGAGLQQSVRIANDPVFTDAEKSCSSMTASIVLRDGDGRVLKREQHTIPPNGMISVPLSETLLESAVRAGRAPSEGELVCGAVETSRRWKSPSTRGTTRPQLLIEGRSGNGSVHSQGPAGIGTYHFSLAVKPDGERSFLAVTNADSRVLTVQIDYPLNADDCQIRIPAFGARLIELDAVAAARAQGVKKIAAVTAKVDGGCKTHLLTASPNLDRVAIDHPAEA
ncbi:MAG: hypothetical protein R8L07_12350 [Alphaproteobacteria bacterium]|nr:hypothetical protein [Alphaproteobacteria bacterium]